METPRFAQKSTSFGGVQRPPLAASCPRVRKPGRRRRPGASARPNFQPICLIRHPPAKSAPDGGFMRSTLEELESRRAAARLGGGAARIAAQHKKGKLSARE